MSQTRIRKAVVLAAGKGRRMAELTRTLPKPLLSVAGRPLLHHVLEGLRQAGIEQMATVIGHCGEQIRDSLAGGPWPVTLIEQQEVDGTGSATLLAREFVAGEPFLLTFGDILAPAQDYRGAAAALAPGVCAVLGVHPVDDPHRGAAVYEEQGRVWRIVEKPAPGSSTTHWNSAGIYAFTPEIFSYLEHIPRSPRGEYELTSAIESMLAAGREVRIYVLTGYWLDVGRPEDLQAAEALLLRHSQLE
ncbi:MAG: sugar phosphate nucleotidyltransferase [Bryobacteraceae bacterium]|nr:sugar phosphate nucleotidyltransferase [Bryobacteraceae bacterium]MDW8376604.1 sugar phosphate nucleotidyltransferase [Bryobacterales bacterium]